MIVNGTETQVSPLHGEVNNNMAGFEVSYAVVQIAIGITIGLFLGTLLAYPMGKGKKFLWRQESRSGIFTF